MNRPGRRPNWHERDIVIRAALGVVLLAASCLVGAVEFPVKHLAGLEPLRTETSIVVQNGSAWTVVERGGPYDGIEQHHPLVLDAFDPSSYDDGIPVNGRPEWLTLWIRQDIGSGAYDIVFSRAVLDDDLVMPPGWTLMRKLPYEVRWEGRRFAPVVMTGWPKPRLVHSDCQLSTRYRVLLKGSATNWTDVHATPFIAPSARTVYLLCDLRGAGAAYIRTPGKGSGMPCGNAFRAMPYDRNVRWLAVSSDGRFQYRVTSPSATLSLYVCGYGIDQTY